MSLKNIQNAPISIGEFQSLGEIFLRKPGMKVLADLDKADGPPISASAFVSMLMQQVLSKGDESALTQSEVEAFTPIDRARAVEAIISQNKNWFSSNDISNVESTNMPTQLERMQGETEEEFLTRGCRLEVVRMKSAISEMLNGLSKHVRSTLGAGLTENLGASTRVDEIIKSMRGDGSAIPQFKFIPRAPIEFKIPPNPIYETNELLAEVAAQIAQMRELAAATADMQRTLNDTASVAVADFSAGAEASRTASKYGLWIAGTSLIVSILALGITYYQGSLQNKDVMAREAAARLQNERLKAVYGDLAVQVKLLTRELERSKEVAKAEVEPELPSRGEKPRSTGQVRTSGR